MDMLYRLLDQYAHMVQFYAQELATVLSQPSRARALAVLQCCAQDGAAVSPHRIATQMGWNLGSTTNLCADLRHADLLILIERRNRTAFYRVTSLGAAVVTCFSPDVAPLARPVSPTRAKRTKRVYDWMRHEPDIARRRARGETPREIGQALGIPRQTIQNHLPGGKYQRHGRKVRAS